MGKPTHEESRRWKRSFGYRVRLLREEAGLSQAALAEAAGLHPTYVSGIERGLRNVALVNIVGLARALTLDPADLLRGVGWREGN
jgi:transcriptional regulator with XRE-family HTH domain